MGTNLGLLPIAAVGLLDAEWPGTSTRPPDAVAEDDEDVGRGLRLCGSRGIATLLPDVLRPQLSSSAESWTAVVLEASSAVPVPQLDLCFLLARALLLFLEHLMSPRSLETDDAGKLVAATSAESTGPKAAAQLAVALTLVLLPLLQVLPSVTTALTAAATFVFLL